MEVFDFFSVDLGTGLRKPKTKLDEVFLYLCLGVGQSLHHGNQGWLEKSCISE